MNTLLQDLGIPPTAHSLRHRFATEFARIDPDLRNLQTVMGHSDISTTTIYAQVEPEACANGVVALAERTAKHRQPGPAGEAYRLEQLKKNAREGREIRRKAQRDLLGAESGESDEHAR